jgi:peptidoglycan/xylan/chitin deacetylase (PgdA/CDA1 family)
MLSDNYRPDPQVEAQSGASLRRTRVALFILLAAVSCLLVACLNQSVAETAVVVAETAVSPTSQPTQPTQSAQSVPPTAIASPATPTVATPTLAAPTMTATAVAPTPTATTTITPTALPTLAASFPSLPEALPTPNGIYSRTLRVPILMYHYLSVPPPDADIYRTDLSVTPDNFRQQMAYLAENGYTPIDFYDLSLAITNQLTLPEKPVILTFDDGYLDNYQNAFPILQEFGFIATFFVVTDFVDQGAQAYATWPMLREMAAAGMRIESHSRNHPDLSGRGRDFLIWQMLGSQETIAAHIGYLPKYFCYPSGRYDETATAVLEELGFWGAVTTQSGKWHGFTDRYEWRRLRMHYTTTLPEFAALVDPGNTRSGITIP